MQSKITTLSVGRRDFLRGAIATSVALTSARHALAFSPKRHFAPVKVARDRVIREVVGLRPYRRCNVVFRMDQEP